MFLLNYPTPNGSQAKNLSLRCGEKTNNSFKYLIVQKIALRN